MSNAIETQSIYLPDQIYDALKTKLVAMVANNFDHCGTDAETEVVTALGEIGNIWPEFVLGDVADDTCK